MTEYKKYITKEGKNKVLQIAFSNQEDINTFKFLALGEDTGGNLASETGNTSDFHEVSGDGYYRIGSKPEIEEHTVEFDNNGSVTISFIVDEQNYSGEGVTIREIALCDAANTDETLANSTVFAFCEVPPIQKTGNVSLKYTIKISIE